MRVSAGITTAQGDSNTNPHRSTAESDVVDGDYMGINVLIEKIRYRETNALTEFGINDNSPHSRWQRSQRYSAVRPEPYENRPGRLLKRGALRDFRGATVAK